MAEIPIPDTCALNVSTLDLDLLLPIDTLPRLLGLRIVLASHGDARSHLYLHCPTPPLPSAPGTAAATAFFLPAFSASPRFPRLRGRSRRRGRRRRRRRRRRRPMNHTVCLGYSAYTLAKPVTVHPTFIQGHCPTAPACLTQRGSDRGLGNGVQRGPGEPRACGCAVKAARPPQKPIAMAHANECSPWMRRKPGAVRQRIRLSDWRKPLDWKPLIALEPRPT